jgi:hypothetical protein
MEHLPHYALLLYGNFVSLSEIAKTQKEEGQSSGMVIRSWLIRVS